MTTTLINLSTPRPLAIIPRMLRISEIITIIASKALKTSNKYMKLLAKDLSMISVKKHVRKAVSILESNLSLIPSMSAKVNQKRINIV